MAWLELLTDRSARRWLCRMGAQLDGGLAALAASPELRAEFRGHLAAAADVIRCEEQEPRPEPTTALVLLASHAYDVRERATREGWIPPGSAAGWRPGDWYGLRLLACYRLAAELPHGPKARRVGR